MCIISVAMHKKRQAVLDLLDRMAKAVNKDLSGLARSAGLAPSTLTRFVNGEATHILSTRTLSKLSEASGVPIDFDSGERSRNIPPPSLAWIAAARAQRMKIVRATMAPTYSDEAVAELLDMPIDRLRHILEGKIDPTLDELDRFVRRMRITADFVLSGKFDGMPRQSEARLIAAHPELLDDPEGSAPDTGTVRPSRKTNRLR